MCPEKAKRWSEQIRLAVDTEHLDSGSAQKLAGRLNFATQHLFHKVGRAMIKPVYAQKTSGSGKVGPRLLAALKWWLVVLVEKVSEQTRHMLSLWHSIFRWAHLSKYSEKKSYHSIMF